MRPAIGNRIFAFLYLHYVCITVTVRNNLDDVFHRRLLTLTFAILLRVRDCIQPQ